MLAKEFIAAATGRRLTGTDNRIDDSGYRRELLGWLNEVHQQVRCEHAPAEAYLLADAVLALEQAGPIVECGAFEGGMTVKLSRVCADTARELYVCDTFAGLPDVPSSHEQYAHYPQRTDVVARFGATCQFPAGDYCGELASVVQNLSEFGALEVCRFVVGEFSQTLPTLAISPQLVWMDVDLIESGRDCLRWLWPKLAGEKLFTHEAFNQTFMQGILAPVWWAEQMQEDVPKVAGDIYGLHPHASCLAYLRK